MSHTTLLALLNNLSNEPIIENFTAVANETAVKYSHMVKYLSFIITTFMCEFLEKVEIKYTNIFGDNHLLAFIVFIAIAFSLYTILLVNEVRKSVNMIKQTEEDILNIKKKFRIQEGDMVFALEHITNIQTKFIRLTKQVKKLQKEINEYA